MDVIWALCSLLLIICTLWRSQPRLGTLRNKGEKYGYLFSAIRLNGLAKEFKPSQQTANLARDQLGRLIVTCILAACMIITLKSFEDNGNLRYYDKSLFHIITTALSVALSINLLIGFGIKFSIAFSNIARSLRWRLLIGRPYTRIADLILGGDSILEPLNLLWPLAGKPMFFFWIGLNMAAQTAVSSISLTYTLEYGLDSKGTYTTEDFLNASTLEYFYGPDTKASSDAPDMNMKIANSYGRLVRGDPTCFYALDGQISQEAQLCEYFQREDGQEFAYRFWELNPKDVKIAYPYLTDRNIRAYPRQCFEYQVRNPTYFDTSDGTQCGMSIPFYNETYSGTIQIPRYNSAFDATTFIWNDSLAPQNATVTSCGPRCLQVFAFRSHGIQTNRSSAMFSCSITVSEVNNATQPAHNVPDDVARIAAASIALSGRYMNMNPYRPGEKDWHQYQLYPWGSYWEINLLNAQKVGSRMAEFAIASIRGMSLYNPPQRIRGTLPSLGYHLSIQWKYVIALLTFILVIDFLHLGFMLWATRLIDMVDYCNLPDLVQQVDDGESLLNGKKILKTIQEESIKKLNKPSMKRSITRTRANTDGHLKKVAKLWDTINSTYFTSIANACTILSPRVGAWIAPLGKPARPDGFKRFTWPCRCGHIMYADIQEKVPEAAQEYIHELSRPISEFELPNFDQIANYESRRSGSTSRVFSRRSASSWKSHIVHSAGSRERVTSNLTGSSHLSASQHHDSPWTQASLPNLPATEDEPSIPDLANGSGSSATSHASSLPEKRFILLCINADKYFINLKQINVTNMIDDQLLFFKIRRAYKELRGGRVGIFSLVLPVSVEIVKFELIPLKMSTPCVGVLEAAYPPPLEVTDQRYHYAPCPINLDPPISANVFLHAFFNPSAHTFQFWLNRLPKKLKDELISQIGSQATGTEPKIGWGIHIVEGLNWFLITGLVTCLLICTGIFAVVWTILRHNNIQEGFAVGQYLVAVETAMMSALIIRWTSPNR